MAKKTEKPSASAPRVGVPTRRLLAAWLLEKDPYTTDVEIDKELDRAFPDDRLRRSEASRYRTLVNQGKLWAPTTDPRTW